MCTMMYFSLAIMLIVAAIGAASILSECVELMTDDEHRND